MCGTGFYYQQLIIASAILCSASSFGKLVHSGSFFRNTGKMNYCKKCENPLDEMAYIICSGECAKRFHSICVDLTKDQLALLSSANIKWMCDQCVCRQLYLQSQSLLMPFQELRRPTQSKNVFEKRK